MATKIRYVSSIDKDYLLPPSAPRRYTNSMIGYFAFAFSILAVLISHFAFAPLPFVGPLFRLLITHNAVEEYGQKMMTLWFEGYGIVFAIAGFAAWHFMNWATPAITRQVYLRGNRLEDGPKVLGVLDKEWSGEERGEIALIRKGETDWNYDESGGSKLTKDIFIPESVLELSTVIRGEAGSGKSVVLNRLIRETIKNRHKLILHSVKGDEIKMLHEHTRFYLVEPWRKNGGYAIDFLSLCIADDTADQNARIRTLVDSFNPSKGGGKSDFFDKGAASVIEAIVRAAIAKKKTEGNENLGLEEIVELWNSFNVSAEKTTEGGDESETLKKIKDFVGQYNPSATIYVDPQNPKTSLSVLASCIEIIRKFEVLSSFWKGKKTLDIRQWVNAENDRRTILLVNSNVYSDVADAYISAFINLITTLLIDVSYEPKGKIYFALDEFPQLRSIDIDTFLKLPDVGRGKGVRVVVALQRTSQIKESFNKDGQSFCGAFQNKIWARCSTDDLEIMGDDLGKKDVLEHSVSISYSGGGKTTARKETEKQVQVANPHELQNELGPQKDGKTFKGVRVLFKFSNLEVVPVITMPPVEFPKKMKIGKTAGGAASSGKGKVSEEESGRDGGKGKSEERADELEFRLVEGSPQAHDELDPPTVECESGDDPLVDSTKEAALHAFDHSGTAGVLSATLEIADSMASNGQAATQAPVAVLEEGETGSSLKKKLAAKAKGIEYDR